MSSPRVDPVELVTAVTKPTLRWLLDLLLERGESTPTSHYGINIDRLDDATQSLSELASTWEGRLLRIKRLAEAAHAETRRRSR